MLRGYSYGTSATPVESGVVALLRDGRVSGLSRLIQGEDICLVEGSLSGVLPGTYRVEVHKGGDISQGADTCGGVFGEGTYF